MGTLERRERERQVTRAKIMDAARDLFAREGYDAVSMRRISEVIDYSPTAIYALAGGGVFVDHGSPFGRATIVRSPDGARSDALVIDGFLLSGLLDEEF